MDELDMKCVVDDLSDVLWRGTTFQQETFCTFCAVSYITNTDMF